MNLIASFFLRAKHWQLFLLLVGIGFVGDIGIFATISTTPSSPQALGRATDLMEIVMVPFMFCFLGWFWSMGSFLSSILQPIVRVKTRFLGFAIVYPGLYMFVFFALFLSTKPWMVAVIFPLHLFAMFCIFYDLYFVARNLVLVETGSAKSFYDYAGPFFLLWFFPVGVWIIQPRINRLYLRGALPPLASEPVGIPSVSTQDAFAEEPPTDSPPVYAGFWLRLAAASIDALAMFVPFCFVSVVVLAVLRLVSEAKGYDPAVATLTIWPIVVTALSVFYFAFLESSLWQATLGQKVVGLRVSDVDGQRLTLGRATGRNLAKCVSVLTIGVGFIMCGFTKKKRALHDIIAGCLVLRRPH